MSDPHDAARLAEDRRGMAGRLAALAALDQGWRAAFETVPREAFIPDTVWDDDVQGSPVPISREQEPGRWHGPLYREGCAIGTQLDDGDPDGPGVYTSSSSTPEVMARMLAELPPAGARVLEVGTGTGYNAALLAEYYGPGNVASVELDEALADRAEKALAGAGYPVPVLRGDGVDHLASLPYGLSYDALICTCAIAHLPRYWLHAVPDGTIVAPFYAGWLPVAVLVLHVRDGEATGRFKRNFSFMHARAHRWEGPRPTDTSGGRERRAPLSPHLVTSDTEAAAFHVSLRLPGVDYLLETRSGLKTLTAWDSADPQSWAVVDWVRTGPAWRVREAGPRDLWAEVESAYRDWARYGEPGVDRYAVEVDGDGARVTLDGRHVADLPAR